MDYYNCIDKIVGTVGRTFQKYLKSIYFVLKKIITYSRALQWSSFPIHHVLGCKKSSQPPILDHIFIKRKYFVKKFSLKIYFMVQMLSHILGNLFQNCKKTLRVLKPPSHPNFLLANTLLTVFYPNHLWTVPGNQPYQLLLWIAPHMLLYDNDNRIAT